MSDLDWVAIALILLFGVVLALQAILLKGFSLRSLLIATTLVAVALGLIGAVVRQSAG